MDALLGLVVLLGGLGVWAKHVAAQSKPIAAVLTVMVVNFMGYLMEYVGQL